MMAADYAEYDDSLGTEGRSIDVPGTLNSDDDDMSEYLPSAQDRWYSVSTYGLPQSGEPPVETGLKYLLSVTDQERFKQQDLGADIEVANHRTPLEELVPVRQLDPLDQFFRSTDEATLREAKMTCVLRKPRDPESAEQ